MKSIYRVPGSIICMENIIRVLYYPWFNSLNTRRDVHSCIATQWTGWNANVPGLCEGLSQSNWVKATFWWYCIHSSGLPFAHSPFWYVEWCPVKIVLIKGRGSSQRHLWLNQRERFLGSWRRSWAPPYFSEWPPSSLSPLTRRYSPPTSECARYSNYRSTPTRGVLHTTLNRCC